MMEAIGNWVHHNRKRVDIDYEVDESALPAEMQRRRHELAKR